MSIGGEIRDSAISNIARDNQRLFEIKSEEDATKDPKKLAELEIERGRISAHIAKEQPYATDVGPNIVKAGVARDKSSAGLLA